MEVNLFDEIDMEIIKILQNNSRIQLQDIGNMVHLTGQAVRNRITRLEKLGAVEGYTIKINMSKLGLGLTAFVTVYMKTNNHAAFYKYLRDNTMITEAHRVSGEGCYSLKAEVASHQMLEELLDGILQFGNYKVNLSISRIK
jgi:Lrp/AsnC family leucine-responsive transcriptional regulator